MALNYTIYLQMKGINPKLEDSIPFLGNLVWLSQRNNIIGGTSHRPDECDQICVQWVCVKWTVSSAIIESFRTAIETALSWITSSFIRDD